MSINATELNEKIDPISLLQLIGYAKSQPKISGDEVRDYCPIHKGDTQQSLAINKSKRVYFCQSCGETGDLIDLYTKSTGVDFKTAIDQLASKFACNMSTEPFQTKIYPQAQKEASHTPYTTSVPSNVQDDVDNTLAISIWDSSSEEGRHEYFDRKKIQPCPGVRYGCDKMGNSSIIVPCYTANMELKTLQYVNDGGKFFLSRGEKEGTFFPIGDIRDGEKVYVAEGLATAITIWEALGKKIPVVSANGAGNVPAVVAGLRKKYHKIEIVLALDNDKAGMKVKDNVSPPFTYCMPCFEGLSIPDGAKAKDFNDLVSVCNQSLEYVRGQIQNRAVQKSIENSKEAKDDDIPEIVSMNDRIKAHDSMLSVYRGKKHLGLRVKTINEFNDKLKGLRKLILLAAAPNVGKTALTIQLAQEVLSLEKDACLLYLSLEMTAEEIFTRMALFESGLDFDTYVLGTGKHENDDEPLFSSEEFGKIEKARKAFEEIGDRLQIIDTSSYANLNATNIIKYIEKLKSTSGCTRSIIVIDYLQVWPTPQGQRFTSDIEADKWRIGEIKKIRDAVNKEDQNPVIVISEARKPNNNEEVWGGGLSDIMGSARGGYTPDVVLLLSQLQQKAFLKIWDKATKSQSVPDTHEHDDLEGDARRYAEIISFLAKHGMAPCRLVAPKVRDGMNRFSILLMFHFKKNRFTPFECPEFRSLANNICQGKK